jgi:hypothetical protein
MRFRAMLALAAVLGGCVVDDPSRDPREREAERAMLEAQRLRSEVLQQLDRYYRDFSARNWEAVATHFWPGATITTITTVGGPQGGASRRVVTTSVADFIAGAVEGPETPPLFEERMSRAEVRVEGPIALVWATYRASFGKRGSVEQWTGTDAFTLVKHDGRWGIVSLTFAPE